MASYDIQKVVRNQYSLQDFLDVHSSADNLLKLSGFISNTKFMWMTCGPYLEIRETKTGNKIGDYTFGAAAKDTDTQITCVKELNTQFSDSSILVIGLECINGGMVCIFDNISWRVLRAIQTPQKVTYISVVNAGNEDSSFPGPLNNFDGALSVGMYQGDILVVDLCRQAINEALKINGISEIKGEVDPSQLTILSVNDINSIEQSRKAAELENNHLAIHLNDVGRAPHFILKGQNGEDRIHVNKEEVVISSLHYAPQLSSLFVGFNFGALQIWDLINMNLIYTSPVYSENIPISYFAILEPVDDPRAFCYFWAIYSSSDTNDKSFPLAALYSLSYESKDWHEGYGYLYSNLLSCAVRFQADLSMIDNKDDLAIGAQCIKLESFSKGLNSVTNSMLEYNEDSYTLCEMVWNVVCKNNIVHTYLSVFDLNQWYKEQMPSAPHYHQCKSYMSIVCISDLIKKHNSETFPLMNVHIDGATIRSFVGAQRLEEHYYPASLSFDLCCISEMEIYFVKNHGLQKQLYRNMEMAGPLALMKPGELYQSSITLGLTPLFMESYMNISLAQQREHLLSVALENRMESWICKCATSWGNGSHRAAGLSLDLLLNWAWQRANTLKNNADKLCVPLFDQTGTKMDANSSSMLSKCRKQIYILKNVYSFICNKCSQFLINPEITIKQRDCLTRVYTYLDVLGWLINVGLLPEFTNNEQRPDLDEGKLQLPYSVESLKSYYNERRANLNILIKSNDIYQSDFLLYIDKITDIGGEALEREWKCDGGTGQYPPSSIQVLLRTYLIENIDMQLKHTIVTYLLLDLAMTLDDEQYKTILPTLIKFPNIFNMSPSVTKIIQGFWQLDHGELETATENLSDPMIKPADLESWQHKYLIESLILQDQEKMALLYMKGRQIPLTSIDDIRLNISLLVNNKLLSEAFALQRKHFGNTELLDIIFKECLKTNQLNDLNNLNLSRIEEEALFKFMKENSYENEVNFQSVYYIQRSRMFDFYQSQCENKDKVLEFNVGKCITETLSDYMPKIDKKILNTCINQKAKLFNKEFVTEPMSVFLHNSKEHMKYKSDLLIASITKARETWLADSDVESNCSYKLTDEDFPFVRPPLYLPPRKRLRSDLIYPKLVDNFPKDNVSEIPTPPKKSKLSPRESVHTPANNDSGEIKRLTKIETPIIVKKSLNLKDQLDSMSTTPQSILKVTKVRDRSKSPVDRGNSTTPENLDEIDDLEDDDYDVSFLHSTKIMDSSKSKISCGIAPRKSLIKNHGVRFSGINRSSSLTQSGSASSESKFNSSEDVNNSLQINPLPEVSDISITNVVTENKSTSLSTDNETFYSPEASIEEAEPVKEEKSEKMLTIPEIFLKREKSPVPGSPKSRKSYKGDILERPPMRSSPRLNKSETSSPSSSSATTNVEILSPEQNLKSKKRVSARKSLSRMVLENNAITKMRSTPVIDIDVEKSSTITVETSFSKTEVVKKVMGNVIEEITDKIESKNIHEKKIEGNTEKVKVDSHEESSKTMTRIEEDQSINVFSYGQPDDVFDEEEEMDIDEIEDISDNEDKEVFNLAIEEFSNGSSNTDSESDHNVGVIVDADSNQSSTDGHESTEVNEGLRKTHYTTSRNVIIEGDSNNSTIVLSIPTDDSSDIYSQNNTDSEIDHNVAVIDESDSNQSSTNEPDSTEDNEGSSNSDSENDHNVCVIVEADSNQSSKDSTEGNDNKCPRNKHSSTSRNEIVERDSSNSSVALSILTDDPTSTEDIESYSNTGSENVHNVAVIDESDSNQSSTINEVSNDAIEVISDGSCNTESILPNEVIESANSSSNTRNDANSDVNIEHDQRITDNVGNSSLHTSTKHVQNIRSLMNSSDESEQLVLQVSSSDEDDKTAEITESIIKDTKESTSTKRNNQIDVVENILIAKESKQEDNESLSVETTINLVEKNKSMEKEDSEILKESTTLELAKNVSIQDDELDVTDVIVDVTSKKNAGRRMTDIFDKTQWVNEPKIELNLTDQLETMDDSYVAPTFKLGDTFDNSKSESDLASEIKEDIPSDEIKLAENITPEKTVVAKRRRSTSVKNTEILSPIKTRRRSLAESGTNSPVVDTPTRVLRPRRSSTSTESPSVSASKKATARTRSASVDVEVTVPKRRSIRAKSVDNVEEAPATPKTRARRTSTALPAIDEETKSEAITAYTTKRKLTRNQKVLLEKNLSDEKGDLDFDKLNPLELMDKEEFKGEADPEEQGILQSSPTSSIASSSVDTARSKKTSSVSSNQKVLTPRKRKTKGVTEDSPPKTLRRGRSASVEIQDEAVPLTPTRRTRKSSQDSVASDASVEPRRSSRRKSKSEVSDSDGESAAGKKGTKLKTTLSKIKEESEEEIAKPKRGRKKTTD
ncbi:PREDICTED: protein ELYS isoform X2 [Nicrophorus vespilloides]|uniref:Protein ELYS isoform X2 n=1 Tax=Nicrophorus vespilloides TaxID=110193 RepID=A0ABM1MT06_NICVS|nr:PREDICTED: protein ELYS isoform X2 [Nicrophorus vespilloides]